MRTKVIKRIRGAYEYTYDLACGDCGDDDPGVEKHRMVGSGLRWMCDTCAVRRVAARRRACAKHITEARGRIAELETILRQAVADDGGLYDLGLRAGRAAASDEETDECIAAADALEARIAAALCDNAAAGLGDEPKEKP